MRIGPLLPLALMLVFLPAGGEGAVSLAGTSGLINIPTADILEDGEIVFGASYMESNYTHFDDVVYPITPLGLVLGYLPGLELSARLTVINGAPPQTAGLGDYKDGMASVQIRLKREGRYLPAVALGARDVYGFALFNALYGVISKRFPLPYVHRPAEDILESAWIGWGHAMGLRMEERISLPGTISSGFSEASRPRSGLI